MTAVSRRRFLASIGLGALAARLLGTERPAVSSPEVGQVITGKVLGNVREGDLLEFGFTLRHRSLPPV